MEQRCATVSYIVCSSDVPPLVTRTEEADMIYLLNATGLTPGGSSTIHINTQTIHRTTQITNWEECGPCTVFAICTMAFALQLRKKQGLNLSQGSRRVPVGTVKTEYTEQYITVRIHNLEK